MSTAPALRSHRAAMAEKRMEDPAYAASLETLEPYERIARLVIRLRMERGFSQEELARRVGTSASAIARLESGNHRPSVETLRRVARALDRGLVIGFEPSLPGRPASPSGRRRAGGTERHMVVV